MLNKCLSPSALTKSGPSSSTSSLSSTVIMFLWCSLFTMIISHIRLSESGTVMLNDNKYPEMASAELLRFVNDDNDRGIRSLSSLSSSTSSSSSSSSSSSGKSVYNDDHNINKSYNIQTNILNNDHDNDIDNDHESNNKNNYDHNEYNNDSIENLSLADQVRLLSKQLNVLMTRRREDYELLERNLLKSLTITQQQQQQQQQQQSEYNNMNSNNNNNVNLHKELQQLREEVHALQSKHLGGNNERLTIEWLQQSVSELRKQLVELQQIASDALHDVTKRTQSWEDLTTIRSDFQQLKLELVAHRERQQQTEMYVQELRDEIQQQEDEFYYLIQNKCKCQLSEKQKQKQKQKQKEIDNDNDNDENISDTDDNNDNNDNNDIVDTTENFATVNFQAENTESQLSSVLLPDHRRRHCRYQRQQLHELQQAQRQLKRQLNELKYQRLGARVRSLEIEQHRIADANFNLSRQIASLDKLHVSMLELLEDVETVQSKVDKNIPELRHEISKLEFSNAQLQSEQNIIHEEGKNLARSVQALSVTINTLQEERDSVKQIQSSMTTLMTKTNRLQNLIDDIQRSMIYYKQHRDRTHKRDHNKTYHHNLQRLAHNNHNLNIENAETLVVKLENAEHEFEAIIDKLPRDCSEVLGEQDHENNRTDGLYLIAPNGESHRPLMAHCTKDGWTTVQRRYDGSANFNRSWEDYATGFGSPAGEFWMGNEHLHQLTLNNCSSLRILMQDIYDNIWLAEYKQFYVSSRSDGYRLHITNYSGNASDALDYQQDMQFSAIDVDRDISQTHCAANYEGGWWFSHCQHANLNGRYNLGLTWFDASRNEWIAVKSSQMMIKPLSSAICDNFKIQKSLNDNILLPTTKTTTTTATETETAVATASATTITNRSLTTITTIKPIWSPNSNRNSESPITTSNIMNSWQV